MASERASDDLSPAAVLCLFAKPPLPGVAKTRLAAIWGAESSAALARAFLVDCWSALHCHAWARLVLATTGDLGDVLEVGDALVWPQGAGDLGERMERVLRRALEGAPIAIALGADTPGLPPRLVAEARDLLAAGADAVLGPADDGGFYLLGLRRCPSGLLSDLPWSAADTMTRTHRRLREMGMTVELIEPWFDVDLPEDLHKLSALLARGEIQAPETARILGRLSLALKGEGP